MKPKKASTKGNTTGKKKPSRLARKVAKAARKREQFLEAKHTYRGSLVTKFGVPADVVEARLQRIWRANNGELTTEAVVADAADESSPLHGGFCWDNDEAANKYRIQQARWLIRCIVIRTEETEEPQPVWVHTRNAKGKPIYQRASVVMERVGEYEAALAEAYTKLEIAQKSVNDLKKMATQEGAPTHVSVLALVADALGTAREALGKITIH